MSEKKRSRVLWLAAMGLCVAGVAAYVLLRAPGPGSAGSSPAGGGKTAPPMPQGQAPAMAVEMVTLAARRVEEEASAVGNLRSVDAVVLRPEVAGRIASIRFADGQRVRRGELLMELDAAIQQAEWQQAKANLGLAQANSRRSEDLFQRQFISARSRDEAAAQLKVQEAALQLAEARLARMRLRAPFDGVVGLRGVSVGDYVKDGQELVNLESIDRLQVDFKLPERILSQIKLGQPLDVRSDAFPDLTFRSRVEAMDPLVDANGRAVTLRARIDNREGRLRPGQFVRVRLVLGVEENVLMVPEQAIVPSAKGVSVFRVIDGKAVMTPVQTGLRQTGWVQVVSGVQVGDRVVTAGQLKLRDGAAVKPVEAGPPPQEGKGGGASGSPGPASSGAPASTPSGASSGSARTGQGS